jgi:predicted nucleic acid-binding Zn ribbon protein
MNKDYYNNRPTVYEVLPHCIICDEPMDYGRAACAVCDECKDAIQWVKDFKREAKDER